MNIYDIDQISVLMDDHCTEAEAERHLENGACIWSPEDFVSEWIENNDCPDDVLESIGCESAADALAKCKAGALRAADISNGFYRSGETLIPYVITYCL